MSAPQAARPVAEGLFKQRTLSLCNVKRYVRESFLNGLNGLKRDVKRLKTIRAPDGPQCQKRTKTLKKIGLKMPTWLAKRASRKV
ncbi:hypothetical protein NQ318_009134 [Aromia moschata]|uniref:Uncharacterized protein n=1 Tax=Aromia moschata TaxID=1265417 RepID=A0AAV8XJM7_9CUCU|nr:hypothetical protein NQ318_009134 [Aromia moschata]